MMPIILLTDAMVFLLIAVGVTGAISIRRRPHLLLPWQRVAQSGVGMVSLLVLSLFLVVGFLDSLHYRTALPEKNGGQTIYSPEVLSAFDAVVSGLRSHTEKTYSAPLAAYLYSKESFETADGKVLRDYPRLKYGGAHLSDPQHDLVGDVVQRATVGAALGLLAGGLLILAIRPFIRGQWRATLVAMLLTVASIGAVVSLANVYHIFGTDKVGQDVLYLSLKSIRTGLVIGTVTTLVMLPFALFLGVAAGYFRGWADDLIQYIYTVLSSIPGVLLIAAAVLMMQMVIEQHADWFDTAAARADVRLLCLCLILGVTSWTSLCRLLRGETLKLRELEYIQAAQAFGVSSFRILTRHIVPNVMHIVLISVVMDFSGLVLAEAVLSYVGVGVDPATISFGTMINAARMEMGREPMVWWTLAAAFSFMLVLVLSANLFADAVRDAFDPRLNRTS
ncbi:Putative peptide transport permease protein [Ferriphaselus amnicola]|uniref:Peptide transport permease protein n=1 Tax=Ferriphaselus amnicola TaxID=1188319 RepID=A0A2Z6GD81_9PROT|nr:ABC transporter permease [Ferriphaselus amnicola]BBE51563.1 Putative peptide transport permease protein [Ferriphaselus amnicola]